jgi:copper transport protein
VIRWIVGVALVLLLVAPRAEAHASLVDADPADGAVLTAPPRELVLRFDEPVDPVRFRLVDATGRALALGPPRTEGSTLHIAPTEALGRGAYLFSYRVTSADSHPVGASIAFTVGPAPAASGALRATADSDGPQRLAVVVRALRDSALLLAAGGAFFVLLIARFPADRAVIAAAAVAAAALSLGAIPLHGALLLGSLDAGWAEAWSTASRTSQALSAAVAIAGCAVLALGTRARSAFRMRTLLGVGAVAVIGSFPMTGHAMASAPRGVAIAALAVHVATAAFWFGSLPALLLGHRHAGPDIDALLMRFSRVAVAAVAVLLAAGIGSSLLHLESLDALWTSLYGRLILTKAALLAVALGLAAGNRYGLMPRLTRAGTVGRLRLTIGAEIAVLLAVLAATALLVGTPPPSRPSALATAAGGQRAELVAERLPGGSVAFTATLRDSGGTPLDAAAVDVELSLASGALEPLTRSMARIGPGRYQTRIDGLAGGRWRVEIQARIDDFERARWSTEVELKAGHSN